MAEQHRTLAQLGPRGTYARMRLLIGEDIDLAWRPGAGRDVPIVGVPSASIGPRGHGELASWHLLRIEGTPDAPVISLERRAFDLDGTVKLQQLMPLTGGGMV